MQRITEIASLRAQVAHWRQQQQRIALVPTMGNLHSGHLALMQLAQQQADKVVASIFVNPLQFGPNEDYAAYPRTLDADQAQLQQQGVHALFCPSVTTMYPQDLAQQTQITVPRLGDLHCGASRPGHFTGVATIVNKLFNLVQPDIAVFGEKDFQQLAVIRHMTQDLCLPIEIIGAPTQRAADGLALSSRNQYLTPEQRTLAPELYACLTKCREKLRSGDKNYLELQQEARDHLNSTGFNCDYFVICDYASLQPANAETSQWVVLAAAWLGKARLIDNISVILN